MAAAFLYEDLLVLAGRELTCWRLPSPTRVKGSNSVASGSWVERNIEKRRSKVNAKRKSPGRRASDSAVTIKVNEPLDVASAELSHLLSELNKGHTVRIARQRVSPDKANPKHEHRMSFSDVVTMLGSGVALGVATLAVVPAAPAIASVAAVVGVGIGGVLRKMDREASVN